MKVKNKIFIIALILSLILSVTAVAAADDITFDQSDIQAVSDETELKLDANQDDDEMMSANDADDDSNSPVGGSETELLSDVHQVTGNDFKNISDAISKSKPGDTIFLDGKTYNGSSQINVNVDNITIMGGSAINHDLIATLDAEGLIGIMKVTASNVVIKNIKFTNGKATSGGAIYWSGDNGTVENSNFINNTATSTSAYYGGGAIFWDTDAINGKIIKSTFSNNTCYYAGAVRWQGAGGTLTQSRFVNNKANQWGGAVVWNLYAINGTLTHNTFDNNTAAVRGGAVYWNGANGILDNNVFTNNNANLGGAMFVGDQGNDTNLTKSYFENNEATSNSGAIFLSYAVNFTIDNCKFINNTAPTNGVLGVSSSSKNVTLSNSLFINNTATLRCGVSGWGADNGIVDNCTFINNRAAQYGGVFVWTGANGLVKNSTFDANIADPTTDNNNGGGAIMWEGVNGTVIDSHFYNNIADRYGGGAIRWKGPNGTVNNCDFINNTAQNGGAVVWGSTGPNGVLTNCIFVNNTAKLQGGAVYWNSPNSTFKGNTIINNTATYGGAMFMSTANINTTVSDSRFENNNATSNAGAIYISSINVTIDNCEFISNYGNVNGVLGITSVSTNLKVANSIFENNTAVRTNGAFGWSGANGTLTKCNFTNNFAGESSGAVAWAGANGYLEECNFINNKVNHTDSGALYWQGVNGTVTRSNFNNNSAIRNAGAILWSGVNGTLTHSNIANSFANSSGGAVRWTGLNGNVDDCNFMNNSAGSYGGAIIWKSANGTVTNSKFNHNNAIKYNAGAVQWDGVNGTLDNCEFTNNFANSSGGAVGWSAINGTILNSKFNNNAANTSAGGAITWNNAANGNMDNCDFIGNTAKVFGGAVSWVGAEGTLTNSRFNDNSAVDGGGVYWRGVNGTIDDCEFDNNNATNGGAIHSNGDGVTIKNSNFEANAARYSGSTVWVDGPNNSIIGNSIHNEGSDISAIHITNGNNVTLDGNAISGKDISYAEIIIDADDTIIAHTGKNLLVPVTIKDSLGNPLTGRVELFGYFGSISALLEDGKVVFNVTSPTSPTILVVFYNQLHKNIQINIGNSDNPIDDIVQPSGDTDQLEINFPKDATGNVTVIINGKEYYGIVKDGKAVVDLKDAPNGNYQATVVYSGDGNYSNMTRIVPVTVKNSEINPYYRIVENKDINVIYSGKSSFKVLITKNGRAVGAGESVTFNFNGKNTVVKTDANGYAVVNLNTNIKVGTHTIKTTYKDATATNKVKITQVIKASNKKVKKSAKATKIKITLNKVNGKFLSKKTLKIKFNKKTYKVKTNKKGVATWKVKKSMLKKLKVGKKVKYTVTYGKATLTKKLTIKK